MADDTTAKNPPQKGRRDARLAAALRENLRRRKAQLRERGAEKSRSDAPVGEPEAGSKR
jgi:hypothetical protein